MYEKGVSMELRVAKLMKREQDGFNYIRISFMEFITQKLYFG